MIVLSVLDFGFNFKPAFSMPPGGPRRGRGCGGAAAAMEKD